MKLFKMHIMRECSMTSCHCDQWFAAWQFLKKWLLIEDVLTVKEGRSHEWKDNRRAPPTLLYINNVNSKLGRCNTKAPLAASLVHLWAYCTHSTPDVNDVMCEGWPHRRGLCPIHFLNSDVGSFMSHKNQMSVSAVRRDLWFFP